MGSEQAAGGAGNPEAGEGQEDGAGHEVRLRDVDALIAELEDNVTPAWSGLFERVISVLGYQRDEITAVRRVWIEAEAELIAAEGVTWRLLCKQVPGRTKWMKPDGRLPDSERFEFYAEGEREWIDKVRTRNKAGS